MRRSFDPGMLAEVSLSSAAEVRSHLEKGIHPCGVACCAAPSKPGSKAPITGSPKIGSEKKPSAARTAFDSVFPVKGYRPVIDVVPETRSLSVSMAHHALPFCGDEAIGGLQTGMLPRENLSRVPTAQADFVLLPVPASCQVPARAIITRRNHLTSSNSALRPPWQPPRPFQSTPAPPSAAALATENLF